MLSNYINQNIIPLTTLLFIITYQQQLLCFPTKDRTAFHLLTCLLIWFSKTPTSCSHPQFIGGDTGTNWHTVSFLNIYSHYVPACSWQPVLSMLVTVALINRWGVWLGHTAAADGDLFLYCDGEEEEHKGEEAKRTRGKERSQEKTERESVTQIRTHWSFTKLKGNSVWLSFHCNSFQLCETKLHPQSVIFEEMLHKENLKTTHICMHERWV